MQQEIFYPLTAIIFLHNTSIVRRYLPAAPFKSWHRTMYVYGGQLIPLSPNIKKQIRC